MVNILLMVMMMVNDGFHNNLVGGWWFQSTPLKNDGVKVSWDDEIPYGKIKAMFQTTNQQKMVFFETNLGNCLEAKKESKIIMFKRGHHVLNPCLRVPASI